MPKGKQTATKYLNLLIKKQSFCNERLKKRPFFFRGVNILLNISKYKPKMTRGIRSLTWYPWSKICRWTCSIFLFIFSQEMVIILHTMQSNRTQFRCSKVSNHLQFYDLHKTRFDFLLLRRVGNKDFFFLLWSSRSRHVLHVAYRNKLSPHDF